MDTIGTTWTTQGITGVEQNIFRTYIILSIYLDDGLDRLSFVMLFTRDLLHPFYVSLTLCYGYFIAIILFRLPHDQ